MNHCHRFSVSSREQQGTVSICRFADGLELKHARLHTQRQTESDLCFDPDLRLIFTLEGATHLQLEGRDVYLQSAGAQTAALLPVNRPAEGRKIFHCGRQNELVLFCSNQLLAQAGCPPEVLRRLRNGHLEPTYFRPDAAIRLHLDHLLAVSGQPPAWQGFYRHNHIMALLGEVLQTLFPCAGYNAGLPHKRLQKLLALLHDNEYFSSSIETLARLCNSNPTTLQRDFQTAFGSSIARYRREYRLNQARNALKQAQSVYQAAQLAGYDNPECFSKAFKKQFGSSPNKYRAKAV